MKQLTRIILVLLMMVVVVAITLLSPALWKNRIESYLNNSVLNPKGWVLEVDDLSGNLLTTVRGERVTLTHTNGSSIIIPAIEFDINMISILFGKLELNRLAFWNIFVNPYSLRGDSLLGSKPLPIPKISNFNINIDRLHADGKIEVFLADSIRAVEFTIDGSLHSEVNVLQVKVDTLEVSISAPEMNVSFTDSKGFLDDNGISLTVGKSVINGLPMSGDFEYRWTGEKSINAQITLDHYQIPPEIFSRLPLQPNLSSLKAVFQFESDLKSFTGTLDVSNELGLNMSGEFTLHQLESHLQLESLNLSGQDASMKVNGILESGGRFNGTFQLDKFDLSQWLVNIRETEATGYLLVEGQTVDSQIQAFELTAEVEETRLYPSENISISGTVSYVDQHLSSLTPVVFTVGPSRVVIDGYIDFESKILDLSSELTDANTFLINNFWTDSLSSGRATGSLRLWGPFDILGMEGNLVCLDLGYRNIFLDYFELNGSLTNKEGTSSGSAKIKFGNGTWNKYGFESGNGDFKIRPDGLEIVGFELKNGDDFFQLSGFIKGDEELIIDRFQLTYAKHYMVNPRPISVLLRKDGFIVQPFKLHVDDGIVEGFYQTVEPLQGRLKFSNVSADMVHLFKSDFGYRIRGMTFGEVVVADKNGEIDFSIDLSIKHGEVANQLFDDLLLSAFYRGGILHIDEFTLTHGEKTGFQVSGTIPIKMPEDKIIEVDLNSNFKSLDMTVLTQFIPDWYYLDGRVSGDFHLGGTTKQTRFTFDGHIQDAVFDQISLGYVEGLAIFNGRDLEFPHFSSVRENNTVQGSGSLPLDLNLSSSNFGKYRPDGKVNISILGEMTDFIFLTAYLTDVDSIRGDITMDLNIKGPPNKLVRNGSVQIKKGTVYTILMDEPVRDISANARLVDNLLDIQSFSGALYDSQEKKHRKQNLELMGSLDLSSFFKPRYDIKVTGENVFYRSISRDMEGYANISIQMTGRDTLDFTGVIAALDGAIYTEFDAPDVLDILNEEGHITTNYHIRFPIQESFAIRNSQIDAIMTGEITMSKMGSKPWDYSGEIQFLRGRIFYIIGGDVFENLTGSMTFDGQGFNPFLDLSASTRIGEAEIHLGVYGSLDNPQWIFESNKGLSQEDILQLLTFHTRITEKGITSEGIGTQAQSMLGAYLERQFEKNFARMTGLKTLGVGELNISGTNTLISETSGEDFAISANLTEKFSFNYRRSFSLENPAQNRVGVEYKLNPYFSVIGNVDENGKMHMKLRLRYSY